MSRLCHLLVCNVLLAWLLSACSTPSNRAQEHAAALRRLSPTDQNLVLHGQIRPGMDQEAVYIAWGNPNTKTPGGDGKNASETWVYQQRVTIYEPINSYAFYGPYHGIGDGGAGRGFLPDYAYGGIGYEGALRYQPHVRSLDFTRLAEFSGGKVDRYKSADGTWFRSGQPARVNQSRPVTSLTAERTDRTLLHVVRHPTKSTHPNDATRLGLHRVRNPVAHRRVVVAGTHRLLHAGSMGTREKGGVRTASAHGSKVGAQRRGSSGTEARRGVYRLHTYGGASGQPQARAA